MASNTKTGWQVLLVAIWINFSGTVRWMLFAKPRFDALYKGRGLEYPDTLVTNILWVLWGVLAAVVIVFLSRKFTMLHAFVLSWLAVFAIAAASVYLGLSWVFPGGRQMMRDFWKFGKNAISTTPG